MRPPALPQRSRAVVASIGAHAVLLPLIFAAGGLGRSLQPQSPIIEAELIALVPSEPTAPAAGVAAEARKEPAEPAAVEPPASRPVRPRPEPREPAPDRVAEPVAPLAPSTAPPPVDESSSVAEATTRGEADATLPLPPSERVVDIASATTVESVAEPERESASARAEPHQRPLDADNARLLGGVASWTGQFAPGVSEETLQWREDGQEFTAVLRKLPSNDVTGMEQLAVDVTTVRDGERLQTELRMTRLAFSNFAQFVDRWDRDVQIHDDEIDGRFHSNSEITVSRGDRVQPIFRGKVTLAARDVASGDGGRVNRRRTFPAGIETSVRRIGLPSRAVALDTLTAAADRVRHFAGDTRLTFYADGSYGWRDADAAIEQRVPLTSDPNYLIGGEDVTLYVAGTVNGTVLVYTEGRVVIVDDLLYATDPRVPGADDYLGLVAERNIEIAEPAATGPGDLEIHASIYARRQFAVRSYRSSRSGTLHIVGSVAAGSLTATEPRYATKVDFDERLTTRRAPGFPLSDRYELTSWSGEWRGVLTVPD